MNHVLLREPLDANGGCVVLCDGRARHLREVLGVEVGALVRVGLLNGPCGLAKVVAMEGQSVALQLCATEPPPPRPNVDLILAMPRPKVLGRVLSAVASLGVDRVYLVRAARVERSYFQSGRLDDKSMERHLDEGLEQARDTVAPRVYIRERLKPFVEDEVPVLCEGTTRLIADVATAAEWPGGGAPGQRAVLAVGPEGGWVDFERALFQDAGFTRFCLGPRPLRVEVALPALLGALAVVAGAGPSAPKVLPPGPGIRL